MTFFGKELLKIFGKTGVSDIRIIGRNLYAKLSRGPIAGQASNGSVITNVPIVKASFAYISTKDIYDGIIISVFDRSQSDEILLRFSDILSARPIARSSSYASGEVYPQICMRAVDNIAWNTELTECDYEKLAEAIQTYLSVFGCEPGKVREVSNEDSSDTKVILAIDQCEENCHILPIAVRVTNEAKCKDIHRSVHDACNEWISTKEGRRLYKQNNGTWDWEDFQKHVPNFICEKYGFVKLDAESERFVLDEQLITLPQ